MYRICNSCVMDTSAEEITFDDKGICNFCHNAQKMLKEIENDKKNLPKIIREIKKQGSEYNCLIGLSGGVDSSMALHCTVKLGLKPLTYCVDNGYQTSEAQENIMRLVEGLKVPFYRYTIDIPKFRKLQKAFIKSGTANVEIATDHILMATTYEMASYYGIKYVISGGNVATESIMPASWGYSAWDLKFIKSIGDTKGLPTCSLLKLNYYWWIKGIKTIYLLDYFDYNRSKAIQLLKEKYGYKPYGDKHCESLFTRWFQEYYLPTKFGFDKRRPHYSSLINSGQMTRETALKKLKTKFPLYNSEDSKKLIDLIIRPIVKETKDVINNIENHSYKDYPNNEKLYNFISSIVRKCR